MIGTTRLERNRKSSGLSLASCGVIGATLAAGALMVAEVRAQTSRLADLEGIGRFSTLTPLERPARFAGKPFLTESEASEFGKQRSADTNLDRRGETADADLRGPAVNDFWFEAAKSLATVNGRVPTSLIVDPPDGRIPSLTDQGKAYEAQHLQLRREAAAADSFTDAERCLRDGRPPFFPGTDHALIQIVQARDYVAIFQEYGNETRIVPVNGQSHLSPSMRGRLGDPRGRWQDDTFVVDTTNFRRFSDRFDENLHLIERFTRVDRDTLRYEFTIDDPTVYSRPWTVVIPMRRTTDQVHENACHEDNYALAHMLRAARQRSAP